MEQAIAEDQVRTLAEVLEIIHVWDLVIMQGMDHPLAECVGDLPWLFVIEDYLDGATAEQLGCAFSPDVVPENYAPCPLRRKAILEDMEQAIQRAWRFRESPDARTREAGNMDLSNDLLAIDAYLWLLKDEDALRERRRILSEPRALSWICQRYGFSEGKREVSPYTIE